MAPLIQKGEKEFDLNAYPGMNIEGWQKYFGHINDRKNERSAILATHKRFKVRYNRTGTEEIPKWEFKELVYNEVTKGAWDKRQKVLAEITDLERVKRLYQSRSTNDIMYKVMKKENVAIAIVLSFLLPLFPVNAVSYFPLVHSQPESKPIDTWLRFRSISVEKLGNLIERFKDYSETKADEDACGSSADHAKELNDIVEDFRKNTNAEKINIVAHSKGD